MMGIVFNLLEEVVCASHGDATWDALLEAADVSGAYTSLGRYPDQEMRQLVAAAATALAQPPAQVLRWFGRQAIPILAGRYGEFFAPHRSTRPMLLGLNSIIHPEVHKLYPGAICPVFQFYDAEDGALEIGYYSPRQLCSLAHGFIEGTADHYAETIDLHHVRCMREGDDDCLLRIAFH